MSGSNVVNDIFNFVGNAATKLLTLAAGANSSIHSFESSNPLIGDAISLAQQEVGSVPVLGQVEAVGSAVLSFAQVIASITSNAASSASAQGVVAQGKAPVNQPAPIN